MHEVTEEGRSKCLGFLEPDANPDNRALAIGLAVTTIIATTEAMRRPSGRLR